MHFYIAATYLKHFSADPSKGRKSVVRVYNKKLKKEQNLTVENIGIDKSAFGAETEKFHSFLEGKYDNITDLISLQDSTMIDEEKVQNSIMAIFDFILRCETNYDGITRIYNNFPELVKIFGDDPWHTPDIIPQIYFELIKRRKYPAIIRSFSEDTFITCDNPIIIERLKPYGSLYLLPIDRKHLLLLGYCIEESGFTYFEKYIQQCQVFPNKINEQLKSQAKTFIIL